MTVEVEGGDLELAAALLRRYPLCELVDFVEDDYLVSRVPLTVLKATEGDLTLLGHVSRTNPHPRAWPRPHPTLGLVAGAHTYVSPTCYERQPAVPTWNYCSVKFTGRIELIEDGEDSFEALLTTASEIDPKLLYGEHMGDTLSYYQKLLPAILTFRYHIDQVKITQKTSGHRSDVDRAAISAFASRTPFSSGDDYRDLVEWLDAGQWKATAQAEEPSASGT
ncbi:FMN-binding negative transcriptional regulator [Frankia sp. AgB32]|uniref:FMN-binding negative transcriptional regulator n=1 Tax=Frankia sp. AgB32 TaxID=631119 RepID=UPI00200C86B8|nr:FMN-binding negative transcriptional regulator [Frankia sp. AgB32]MCK9895085.1 FMN-binding negative transcriptional regulator [Frankia sp. AgB32]